MPHSGVRVRLCERAPCAQVTRMRTGVVPARQFRGQVQGSPWHRRSRTLEPSAALARGSVLPPSSSLAGLAMPPHPWPVPPATPSSASLTVRAASPRSPHPHAPGSLGHGAGGGRDREASQSLYFNCPAPRPLLEAGRGAGCRSRKHLWFLWGPLKVSLAFCPLGTCVLATTALVKAGPCAHRDPQPGLGHFLPFDIFTTEVSCGDGGVGRSRSQREVGKTRSPPWPSCPHGRLAQRAPWADRRRRGAHLALGDPQVHGFQGPADFSPF